LIRDREFFLWLESNALALARFETVPMSYLIKRSAQIHMNQIAHGGDPFESGSARPLDYGHWVAHKLEQVSQFAIAHGEAVAIGMAIDLLYSVKRGILEEATAQRIIALIERIGADRQAGLAAIGFDDGVELLEDLVRVRFASDRQGDHAKEAAVASLMDDGELSRHVRRARRVYLARREVLVTALC
jgi:3-dehydroquinate synthase